jgi:RNA-directed DNA polymerase
MPARLNPVLRGWGGYFCTGNASLKFQRVDQYVNQQLVWLVKRTGREKRGQAGTKILGGNKGVHLATMTS